MTTHSQPQAGPIGVFDSGLGGLTALRRLRALAPQCDIIYFGDTARVPYGPRDTETLVRFARENVEFLRREGAVRVLVACGTISSVLPKEDWAALPLPCQGVIHAAADAALAATGNGRIGILATAATVRSGSYEQRLHSRREGLLTVPVACPDFVPLIEAGKAESEELRRAAREYTAAIKAAGCDTVILGCTHYPLASRILAEELGPNVTLIDSGGEAAAALLQSLPEGSAAGSGRLRCCVSGNAEDFAKNAAALLGEALLPQVEHIDL
jgi:glutamate racemase